MYRSWAGPKREAGLVLYCPTVHAFIHWNHTLILTNALSSIHTVSACHKENNLVVFIPISIANLPMRFQQHYHFREVWMQQAFNMLNPSIQITPLSQWSAWRPPHPAWWPPVWICLWFWVQVSLKVSLEINPALFHRGFNEWNKRETDLNSIWISRLNECCFAGLKMHGNHMRGRIV